MNLIQSDIRNSLTDDLSAYYAYVALKNTKISPDIKLPYNIRKHIDFTK